MTVSYIKSRSESEIADNKYVILEVTACDNMSTVRAEFTYVK
jgi:hypothetical protein